MRREALADAVTLREVTGSREPFRALLLLGDEDEEMLSRYFGGGRCFTFERKGVPVAVCIVTGAEGTYELRNLAVEPRVWRRGLGRRLVECVFEILDGDLYARTGEAPRTLAFYEGCGFERIGTEKDYFTRNYSRPVIDDGVLLRDAVLFVRRKRPPQGKRLP